ncbi:MAG: cytochrome c peroxidase [Myxococcota bacterium]
MKNVLGPLSSLALALALAGCSTTTPLLEDARFPTGSRTMVANTDYTGLYQVNVDEGSVSSTPLSTADPQILELGAGTEPTRIANVGERLYVTLRGTGEVAVLTETATGLQEDGPRIRVGAEPVGIVANEAGTAVYVAVSLENKVVHIDPATNEVVGEIEVGTDPRWLAIHPHGRRLYIGNARGSEVSSAELDEDGNPNGTIDVVPLPTTRRTVEYELFEPTGRVMGDIVVDPFGEALLVPAMYVDNQSLQPGLQPTQDPTTGYYVNPKPGVGRFNSALVRIPLRDNGNPVAGDAEAIFLAGFVEQQFVTETIRSYPNAVSVSPDGLHYAVSMEASDAVVLVGALDFDRGAVDDFWIEAAEDARATEHGYTEHPHTTIDLRRESGPRSVVWLDAEQAWVHDWMNVSATDLAPGDAMRKVAERGRHGLDDVDSQSARALSTSEMPRDLTVFHDGSAESRALQNGRRLFYGARVDDMVVTGSGVSCSTCHSEGRDDGLTWQLGDERRQTPSLAGTVSATHPVTWTGNVESVAAEAELTSLIRMGGIDMASSEYQDIQRFVDWTRPVILPDANLSDPRIAEGEALFNREDVGCASCHMPGSAFTSPEHHAMYGLAAVNTPTLLGIAATAPYLHDGRAATLRDVLELSRSGEMGDTSMLSTTEMDALEAYLKSL